VRIFSGIQPTGRKHLGNYIGAITQYVAGQERGDPAIYCIVDLHAVTVPYDPAELRERVHDTAAVLMAAGLDPDLQRMHQFKEKSAGQRELVSAGLFLYPVLQAADVLAYRANEVPVGEDQRQHIELMRDIAQRFNARFGEVLVVPEGRYPEVGARVMDLQNPEMKMSTTGGSEQGTVLVLDDPKTIEKKIKSAVTDSGSEVRRAEDKPGVSNLIEILAAVRDASPADVEAEFGESGYGTFKAAVAEDVIDYLAPVRVRYEELRGDEAALEAALAAGADKARAMAAETMADVRRAMGVGPAG
jgi:tryptophanyl-tRNA synthetase